MVGGRCRGWGCIMMILLGTETKTLPLYVLNSGPQQVFVKVRREGGFVPLVLSMTAADISH